MAKRFQLSKLLPDYLAGQVVDLDAAGFVRTSLLLHKDQHDLLRRLSRDCDRSMSSIVRRYLRICLSGIAEEWDEQERLAKLEQPEAK